ncbi:ethionine resistance protein [Dimargaris cristalligena]|nr:ethionine resistance protein [Dimargaris cristalligena]
MSPADDPQAREPASSGTPSISESTSEGGKHITPKDTLGLGSGLIPASLTLGFDSSSLATPTESLLDPYVGGEVEEGLSSGRRGIRGADGPHTETDPLLDSHSSVPHGGRGEVVHIHPERDLTGVWSWPEGLKQLTALARLASPIMVASGIQNLNSIVGIVILGHMGTLELAVATLALTIYSFSAIAPLLGLLTALDTLCSQASTGSRRPGMPGIYLQRCLLLCYFSFIPAIIMWWNVRPILTYLRMDTEVVNLTAYYIRFLIPQTFVACTFEAIKKFYIAQGLHRPIAVIQITCTLVGLLFFYILAVAPVTSVGIVGIPLANFCSYSLNLGVAIYWHQTRGRKIGWAGFSWEATKGWGRVARLAVPGAFMVSTEVVTFDLLTLAMSYVGTTALAAQSIFMITIQGVTLILMSLGVVTANRVGNFLGLAMPHRARLVAWTGLGSGIACGLLMAIGLVVVRNHWGAIFNNDKQVQLIVATVIPLLSLLIVSQALSLLCTNILRGQGRPQIVAVINLIVYYVIVIPAGAVSLFYFKLGIVSLWMSLLAGVWLSALSVLYVVLRSDWDEEVVKCRHRLAHDHRRYLRESPELLSGSEAE